MNSLETR